MKILLLSALPPPEGGIATWTKLVMDNGFGKGMYVSLVNTQVKGDRVAFEKARLSFNEILRNFEIVLNLICQLSIVKPDLVHLNCSLSPLGIVRDFICALLVKILNIPLVIQYHGNIPTFRIKNNNAIGLMILRNIIMLSDSNIVLNNVSYEALGMFNQKKKNNYILPNFINESIFSYKRLKVQNRKRLKVIYIGGVLKAKGCQEIFKVARQLKEIEFTVVGQISNEMKDEVKTISENVITTGKLSFDEIFIELADSDIFLFPSHSEGFPLSVVEAMAIGLPVVATRVGAIPQMIDEGKGGYLFDVGDKEGLSNAILQIIKTPDIINDMGSYNREKAKNEYLYSKVILKLIEIYKKAIQNKIYK